MVERGQSLEESEYFGLWKDIREDAEVYAELTETFKVHLELSVRVVGEEWDHCFVHYTQEVHDVLVLKDLQEMRNLTLGICILTSFRWLDLLIELN